MLDADAAGVDEVEAGEEAGHFLAGAADVLLLRLVAGDVVEALGGVVVEKVGAKVGDSEVTAGRERVH